MSQSMDAPTSIEEILKKNGFYMSTTVGTSMYPLLRNRKDTIVIRSIQRPLKRYDVPLYKRGEKYVLHRIVKVLPEGYIICGDNCLHREYDITDAQIVGVLSEIVRGEQKIRLDSKGYRLYCRIWVDLYPVRYIYKRCWSMIKRILKKVLQ